MKTIVFIGTNKSGSSREAIRAAENLGYFVVLLTNNDRFLEQRTEFPDVHQMILTNLDSYSDLRETISTLRKQGKIIKLIMSLIDPYVHIAASLAEEFCPGIVSAAPIEKMEDKILTRELLKNLPVSPYFAVYSENESLENFIQNEKKRLPLVVKSPVSTGSKSVLPAQNEKRLRNAALELLKEGNPQLLFEEFLNGPQYLVEVLAVDGEIHIVAIIEQEITFFKRYIVTGYCLLAHVNKRLYDELFTAVSSIVHAFGMKNGACHIELRLVAGEWKLIEINPRISGGAMNRIIETAYGINLVKETIQLFLGNTPNLEKKHKKYVYVHTLTIDSQGILLKVTGKKRARKHPGVNEVFIKPRKGKLLHPPLSMGDRYGYVLASANSRLEAESIAREAAKEIRFYLEPV